MHACTQAGTHAFMHAQFEKKQTHKQAQSYRHKRTYPDMDSQFQTQTHTQSQSLKTPTGHAHTSLTHAHAYLISFAFAPVASDYSPSCEQ